jgi:hypothetical protein
MAFYPKSVAYTRGFFMTDSADHISKKTGLTCTVNISKAGAAFAAAGGTVTEIANGWYKVALNTTDTGTAGDLAFHITATGADDTDFVDQIYDTTTANLGVNLVQWTGTAPNALNAGRVDSLASIRSNTAQTGSTSSTIKLDASASATDDFYTNTEVLITGGTGVGLVRKITSYVGSTKVATVSPNWTTTPDNTSTFTIIPTGSVLDRIVEGTTTALQLIRGFGAALLGKSSGLGTATATYRDTADSKNRITATVDSDGNRSSVTLDMS